MSGYRREQAFRETENYLVKTYIHMGKKGRENTLFQGSDPKEFDSGLPTTYACKTLLKYIHAYDDIVDQLFEETIDQQDKWYSKVNDCDKLLKRLISEKESIRNLERDVEDFLLYNLSGDQVYDMKVNMSITQLQETFQRTYEFIMMKKNTIINTRVTYTNIIISIVAVLIAVFSILS